MESAARVGEQSGAAGVPGPRRWRVPIVGLVAASLLVVLAYVWFRGVADTGQAKATPVCNALESQVAGLKEIRWANGTASGGQWISALTDGVQYANPASRRAVANTVAADSSGFVAIAAQLDPETRAQFERFRLAATHPDDPSARPGDPDTEHALSVARSLATNKCGYL